MESVGKTLQSNIKDVSCRGEREGEREEGTEEERERETETETPPPSELREPS